MLDFFSNLAVLETMSSYTVQMTLELITPPPYLSFTNASARGLWQSLLLTFPLCALYIWNFLRKTLLILKFKVNNLFNFLNIGQFVAFDINLFPPVVKKACGTSLQPWQVQQLARTVSSMHTSRCPSFQNSAVDEQVLRTATTSVYTSLILDAEKMD